MLSIGILGSEGINNNEKYFIIPNSVYCDHLMRDVKRNGKESLLCLFIKIRNNIDTKNTTNE